MGRPKGSKSKPLLDANNIIQSSNKENDVNDNLGSAKQSPPTRPKSSIGTRREKKGETSKIYNDLVGPGIGFLPQSKLPQNKVVLQRYLSLREEYGPGRSSACWSTSCTVS